MRTNKFKNEIDEIKKWEEKTKWYDLKYKTKNYTYDFQQYDTIRSFGESIYTGKINIDEAEMDQSSLLKNLVGFKNKSRPRTTEGKDKKNTYESAYDLYEGRELTLNAFKSGIYLMKATKGEGRPRLLASRPSDLATQLKILTPQQMLRRLPLALAQVKAGNTSENLLNEIRKIIYFLYLAEEITV